MHTLTEKERITGAMRAFIRQRPGLDPREYGDRHGFRQESRRITQDLRQAETLLEQVELSGMTADELREGFRAYSGRLSWDGGRLDYCTGQFFPTEFRAAVCAVCAAALWNYHRDDYTTTAKAGESAGDALRRNFRRRFGRTIAERWFN